MYEPDPLLHVSRDPCTGAYTYACTCAGLFTAARDWVALVLSWIIASVKCWWFCVRFLCFSLKFQRFLLRLLKHRSQQCRGGWVQVNPQKLSCQKFGQNKISKILTKIPEYLGKNGAQLCLTSKMTPNVCRKNKWKPF